LVIVIGFDLIFAPNARFWIRIYRIFRITEKVFGLGMVFIRKWIISYKLTRT